MKLSTEAIGLPAIFAFFINIRIEELEGKCQEDNILPYVLLTGLLSGSKNNSGNVVAEFMSDLRDEKNRIDREAQRAKEQIDRAAAEDKQEVANVEADKVREEAEDAAEEIEKNAQE